MAQENPELPKRIMVAVEGSEPSLRESSMKAARYAIRLAASSGASVVGVCVVQIPEYVEESTRQMLREELLSKSGKTLEEVRQLAAASKITFESKTVETSGSISTTICGLADKEKTDMIVLGTRANTSSLTKMMLGSVAAGVVGNASCAVLVVR
jgi:nucleotide-binding universal stress UspA family protein